MRCLGYSHQPRAGRRGSTGQQPGEHLEGADSHASSMMLLVCPAVCLAICLAVCLGLRRLSSISATTARSGHHTCIARSTPIVHRHCSRSLVARNQGVASTKLDGTGLEEHASRGGAGSPTTTARPAPQRCRSSFCFADFDCLSRSASYYFSSPHRPSPKGSFGKGFLWKGVPLERVPGAHLTGSFFGSFGNSKISHYKL